MRKIILSVILLLFLTIVWVQPATLKNIPVGGQVPDVNLTGFWSIPGKQAPLTDFYKDKLLLIDFWATWCTPCLESFPKLHELKNQFRGQLEVLSVTQQQQKTVAALFAKLKELPQLNLTVLTGDTVLHRLFRHRIVPHVVWVNASGKVIGITSPEQVTKENIAAALAGKEIALKEKKDELNFDYRMPMAAADSAIVYRSLLTRRKQGISTGSVMDTSADHTDEHYRFRRLFCFNSSLVNLFNIAAYRSRHILENAYRYILDVDDSSRYLWPSTAPEVFEQSGYKSKEAWKDDNLYCYELIVPKGAHDSILLAYMFDDLNRLSPLKGKMIRKKMPCWILRNKTPQSAELCSKGGRPLMRFRMDGITLESIQNTTLDALVKELNIASGTWWIVNETSNSHPVDLILDVPIARLNVEAFKKRLAYYGFELVPSEREIPVLYLSDK